MESGCLAVRAFVDVLPHKGRLYVGIDPGLHGAIGLLCGDEALAVDIPTIVTRVKRRRAIKDPVEGGPRSRTIDGKAGEADYAGIHTLVREIRRHGDRRIRVALEIAQVQMGGGRARNSANTAYKVGVGYGMWPLYLHASGLSFEEFHPAVWKKAMGLTGQDKEASRKLALKLWPATHECLRRVQDHDRAEALLLAEHLRRRHGGG